MYAAVLSIGTELTRGELLNTNAVWLAEALTELGFTVGEQSAVPDDLEAIRLALTRLATSSEVLVCTGGLGPTSDDMTAAGASLAAGVELKRHLGALESIRKRYAAAGRELTGAGQKQADIPDGAEVLKNPVGTAPGFSLSLNGCRAFFLPGVPREMKRLFSDHIRPQVAGSVPVNTHQIRLRTFGWTESRVADAIADLEQKYPALTLGYRATFPEIEVKVQIAATNGREAETLSARVAEEVRTRLNGVVYGEGDDSFPAYVGRLLRGRGLTVALAESCTGGMLGSLITDVPGSSEYLLLDAVTYSNASKRTILGVHEEVLRAYGAVSPECAAAMAEGARRAADSDIAVSVTGVAGPGGGTEAKPVGTVWMGLAVRDTKTKTLHFKLSGDRFQIRRRASYLALSLVAEAVGEKK